MTSDQSDPRDAAGAGVVAIVIGSGVANIGFIVGAVAIVAGADLYLFAHAEGTIVTW